VYNYPRSLATLVSLILAAIIYMMFTAIGNQDRCLSAAAMVFPIIWFTVRQAVQMRIEGQGTQSDSYQTTSR